MSNNKNEDAFKEAEAAKDYHRGTMRPSGSGIQRYGKLEVVPSKSMVTQRDLSLAYSPGVAVPCMEIFKDPDLVYEYTAKGNLVAVISNGTAVLGLGNIGPLAGKPVMEGKAVLFKKFADLDCFDIEVDAVDVDTFVDTVARLEPTFGGINLEDIRAPECFEIERRLRERMKIPVFHDDQHGTAIISGAAMLNAVEVTGRKLEELKAVFCGGGAASVACARFWLQLGLKKENIIMTDSAGVIHTGRSDLTPEKKEFAISKSAWHKELPKTLAEAMVGADAFIGLSAGNIVTKEMVKAMAPDCLVFAMANPDPEISYAEARAARKDMIYATGRSDLPNQVNNVLGFPFIFRGAMDVRATTINEEMKIAASRAIAALAKEEVPEAVIRAYGGKPISFGRDYIIPKPFDRRVLLWVAPAVAKAAADSGVAMHEIPGGTVETYRARLEHLLGTTHSVMRDIKDRLKVSPDIKPVKIVFPEATNDKVLKAAAQLKEENICEPVLLGDPKDLKALIQRFHLDALENCEIIRPSKSELYEEFSQKLWEMRKRKGCTPALAKQLMRDPLYFAGMYLHAGYCEGLIAGATRPYPESIRPLLQVVGTRESHRVAGVHMMVWKDRVLFFADTTVNIEPDVNMLVNIALDAADVAESFGFEPRVGVVSFSNFGTNDHPEAQKMREVARLLQEARPDLIVDGEMQADSAVNPRILRERFPFCRLREKGANVLLFPNISAGNAAYKLLSELGGAEAVGPILVGMRKPVHVMHMNAETRDIYNVGTIAVLEAQRLREQSGIPVVGVTSTLNS